MTVLFVDNTSDLLTLCEQLSSSSWIAVDTEFLREKTYYPKLCLIQVATDDVIACVDPLAVENINPLLDVLYQPDMTLVFHAARQDLELLFLLRNTLPPNIFDTQIAATVLGYGEQIGYGNLVKTCLDVDLDKAHSRTDWCQRPLTDAQLEYAADDVRHLRTLYHLLQQQLDEKQRSHWLQEDFSALSQIETYQPALNDIWRKIKGAGRLKPAQLATLRQLASWREHLAINKDKPRRWVIKDEVMLDLARFAPESENKLIQIRGFENRDMERYGKDILAQIKLARQIPKNEWPVINKPEPLTNQQYHHSKELPQSSQDRTLL